MKEYKIVFMLSFLVIVLLSWLAIPNIYHVEDYDSTQLKELKMMAKNNDANALNKLIEYYSFNEDRKSIFLVRCATYRKLTAIEKKNIYKNTYLDDRQLLEKECPNNPIDKLSR